MKMTDKARLSVLTDHIGPLYGTENFGLFLYSLLRIHEPRIIVELGSGLGASAFWMALAAKHNGRGHIWTVDNLGTFATDDALLSNIREYLGSSGFGSICASTGEKYFAEIAEALDLTDVITFLHRNMDMTDPEHFDTYPFAPERIDLLFSDFSHGPNDVLRILGRFLPRMSDASSIFIDSASTLWSSYLLLENVVEQLNAGNVPRALQAQATVDLIPVMHNRRIVLIHLTEQRERAQNSTAWLKIEPRDVVPYPLTRMR